MDLKSNILCKHSSWKVGLEKLKSELEIFERNVDLYVVACAIGIYEDKTLESDLEGDPIFEIHRSTIMNDIELDRIFDFLFQNAILNTKTFNYDSETRKKIAFDYANTKVDLNQTIFLTKFANYGMSILAEKVGNHDIETFSNIIDMINEYQNYFGLNEELE